MRRPVRVGLVVVAVRPEGETVLNGVAGMQRAGIENRLGSGSADRVDNNAGNRVD